MSLALIEALEELDKVKHKYKVCREELQKNIEWFDSHPTGTAPKKVAKIIKQRLKELDEEETNN